jgi:hypothetical protein
MAIVVNCDWDGLTDDASKLFTFINKGSDSYSVPTRSLAGTRPSFLLAFSREHPQSLVHKESRYC